jgi:hypothetical protein
MRRDVKWRGSASSAYRSSMMARTWQKFPADKKEKLHQCAAAYLESLS